MRGPRGAPLTTDMAWAVFRAATRLDGCIEKHYFVDAVLPPNIRVRQFGEEPTVIHSKTEVARRLVQLAQLRSLSFPLLLDQKHPWPRCESQLGSP